MKRLLKSKRSVHDTFFYDFRYYILEQIWNEFEEKLIAEGRNSLDDFLSQFEGTEISESEVLNGRFSNGHNCVFPGREEWPEYTTVPASTILREWMRKNYPEYLL